MSEQMNEDHSLVCPWCGEPTGVAADFDAPDELDCPKCGKPCVVEYEESWDEESGDEWYSFTLVRRRP
jgi:hypothetical protein